MQFPECFPEGFPFSGSGPGFREVTRSLCVCVGKPSQSVHKVFASVAHTSQSPGRGTQNCRHFWTCLWSSRFKSVNSHGDRGGPGRERQKSLLERTEEETSGHRRGQRGERTEGRGEGREERGERREDRRVEETSGERRGERAGREER